MERIEIMPLKLRAVYSIEGGDVPHMERVPRVAQAQTLVLRASAQTRRSDPESGAHRGRRRAEGGPPDGRIRLRACS